MLNIDIKKTNFILFCQFLSLGINHFCFSKFTNYTWSNTQKLAICQLLNKILTILDCNLNFKHLYEPLIIE